MPISIRACICFFALFVNTLHANELKQITLQASWFEQFQFAGYYMAQEKGFYNEVGLALTIKPFRIEIQNDIAQLVTDGKVDFAVGKENLILEQAQHKKIIALYALFQSSPLAIFSTKKSHINTFKDFLGKRIMTTQADAQQVSLKSMLSSHHVQESDLTYLPHTHNIKDLINNKTDLISGYVSKTPHDLEALGVPFNTFSPQDYGFDLYSDFLYTSQKFMANNKLQAEAFRTASLKGWQYAFDNIDETVDIIFEKYNEQKISKSALLFEAKALKKLAYLNTPILGVIDENKLKKSFDLYKVLGVDKGSIDFSQFIYDETNPFLFLTSQEKSYLKNKQKITICIDPNWLPYDGFDNTGQHIGLNTEFLDIFRKRLPIPIETVNTESWTESVLFAKQRKCDLLSLAGVTEERKEFLNFTSPYLTFPRVLVTKPHLPFVNNFTLLKDKKVGMVTGYAQQEFIRNTYPNIIVVDVKSIEDGLSKVATGELYGFIDGLDTVGYFLQEDFLGQLKVSGKFDQKRELGLGVRNDHPLLLSIFNKLIDNLSQKSIKSITDKSASIQYIDNFNYQLLWWLLFIVLAIIGAFIYRQSLLKNLNNKLNEKVAEKTKALQELNDSLELKIKQRTEQIEHSKRLLQDVAYRDNLTGVFNRHYLLEKSICFFRQADKLNQPLSLLLIDIDYFKKVNDDHGHIVGDKVLIHFVNNIRKTLRADDLLVRYGGEEFILLLPKEDLQQSVIVAEKLRQYIELHPYQLDKENNLINITISIGVGQYETGDSLEQFIGKADSALYTAKNKGRNQVQTIMKK